MFSIIDSQLLIEYPENIHWSIDFILEIFLFFPNSSFEDSEIGSQS